jgi:hypothetical protein
MQRENQEMQEREENGKKMARLIPKNTGGRNPVPDQKDPLQEIRRDCYLTKTRRIPSKNLGGIVS